MSDQKLIAQFEKRIEELEGEVGAREADLLVFRKELEKANIKMSELLHMVQREIDVALQIQRILVSTEFPNIPGFEFSTKFIPSLVSGGDYFDIFEHEDKFRFGMMLACASGFAMSSLLLSVFLKMTGQVEARRGKEPQEVLQMIINEVMPQMSPKDRASLFYAVVDRRHYEMTYCGVGPIIGILHNTSDRKITRLKVVNEQVNSEFQAPLSIEKISLNPRDRLILCSPAVAELQNPKGEPFGMERLSQAILQAESYAVHEVRNEILYQLQRFLKTKEMSRDVSVIVTEVKDRVIKLAKGPSKN